MGGVSVVLRISGAYCAFLIGSGFATGQEILQFFAGYGLPGVAGCLIFLLAGMYLAVSLLLAGQRHALNNSDEVFRHYAGPVVGSAWGWYTVIVAYSVYLVMLAGAGAVLHEYLDTPVWVGAAAMALAVYLTLYFGLHELVEVIGIIGPVLIVLVVVIALTALLEDSGGVARGAAAAASLEMPRAAPSWWMSAIVYTAMCHTGLAAFLPPLGAATAERRALVWAGILGPLVYTAALALCVTALLGGMPGIETRMIPMLELAQGATPRLAAAFSWIVLAGIFTTAAPFLWIAVVRFAVDGSPRYRALAAALAAAGFAIAIALPFDRLLNLIYPTVGWSGMLLIVFILAKQIKTRSLD